MTCIDRFENQLIKCYIFAIEITFCITKKHFDVEVYFFASLSEEGAILTVADGSGSPVFLSVTVPLTVTLPCATNISGNNNKAIDVKSFDFI